MIAPLTAPPSAETTQPARDTAETANASARPPVAQGFDYYALIRRIRKSTGKL